MPQFTFIQKFVIKGNLFIPRGQIYRRPSLFATCLVNYNDIPTPTTQAARSEVPWPIQVVNRGICTSSQGAGGEDPYNELIPEHIPTIFQWEYAPYENRTPEAEEIIRTSPQVLSTRPCPWWLE
ncbi:hypothetical protein F511_12809 [Dorcoceras hygrometricum]|uniref:Uncharacterized protein n=1 Tax=Dorcoceras hygrometricum TaxID=472368 RepID=A0A2Z7D6G6_9LAMI|nr:hypothetical protein F511_12809 [Dorcoceras hygrometricum]